MSFRMHIDAIGYGSPNAHVMEKADRANSGPMADLLVSLLELEAPANSESLHEIEMMASMEKTLDDDEIDLADRDLVDFIERATWLSIDSVDSDDGIDTNEWMTHCSEVIAWCKVRLNRARPFQVAQLHRTNLYPRDSVSSHTPSFPSGHTIQALLFALALSRLEDRGTVKRAMDAAVAVARSRLEAYYHFPSDNAGSLMIAKLIVDHPFTPIAIRKRSWALYEPGLAEALTGIKS